MKALLVTLLLSTLFISNQANAQKVKVKIKDNVAIVDGNPYFNIILINNSECSISSLNSEDEEISAMWLDYPDPAQISDSNPKGLVRWIELYFPELNLRVEVNTSGRKGLVRLLIQNKIYVDGELNAENVQKMVTKYGMRFSTNRPTGGVNVIIQN